MFILLVKLLFVFGQLIITTPIHATSQYANDDNLQDEQLLPRMWNLEERLANKVGNEARNIPNERDQLGEDGLSLRSSSDPNPEDRMTYELTGRFEPDITHPMYSRSDTPLPNELRVVLSQSTANLQLKQLPLFAARRSLVLRLTALSMKGEDELASNPVFCKFPINALIIDKH